MNKVALVARVLLGAIFIVFGLNGFLGFIEQPPHNEAATSFLGALAATGYMFPMVKVVEILCGLMILTGKFLPLGLILLAPVTVNILLFHTLLDTSGLPIAIVVVVAQLILAWHYRDSFAGVLNPNAKPTGS